MHKIVLTAVITPSDDEVTLDDLRKAIKQLGAVTFINPGVVTIADADKVDTCTESVWIYIPPDEDSFYEVVDSHGKQGGRVITDSQIELLRREGICTRIVSHNPRYDRYGAPLHSTDVVFAETLVGDHGFSVPPEDSLEVIAEDRGDDGMEEIWLEIKITPETMREL